jgi:Protein of unknown function (DUF2442)
MPRLLEVKALKSFRLWLRYDDGSAGDVDVSDLAGHGVFKAWEDPAFFAAVELRAHGDIAWGDQIDLCPDAMYMRLTGKTPEQVFPNLIKVDTHA